MRRPFALIIILCLGCLQLHPAVLSEFSLKKMDGDLFRLTEVLGKKIIIVEFWASWCKPCKKLLKRLDAIQKQYRDGVEVLAISIDEASAFSTVESYIKVRGFGFTVLLDAAGNVARIYNPTLKIPFTMVANLKGEIVYTHTGYVPGVEHEIEENIRKLLKSRTVDQ